MVSNVPLDPIAHRVLRVLPVLFQPYDFGLKLMEAVKQSFLDGDMHVYYRR